MLLIFLPVTGGADVLELKTGNKIEGQFAGGSKDEVWFQVGPQTLKFTVSEVSRISLGTQAEKDLKDFRIAAKEALQELKALSSVTEAGVIYREYSSRVLDVKVKVDQFLDYYKSSPLPQFNEHIADSLGFYVVASSAWNAKLLGNGVRGDDARAAVAENEYVQKCKLLQERIALFAGRERPVKPRNSAHIISYYGIPYLWECARDARSKAEITLNP